MAELVEPDTRFHNSFIEVLDEFDEVHVDGAGLAPVGERADMRDTAAFVGLVQHLLADAVDGTPRPKGRVLCTYLWLAEGEDLLGFIAIRHRLTDHLLNVGGHIGYSIRPTARRRGLASSALHDAFPIARELGIERALLTCDEDNIGSRRTIEKNGGVYEDSREGKRRYWIDIKNR